MSDLISRSALIKHLTDWRLQECPIGVCEEETETYKTICECIEAVKEQPVVYNVDAVVEEIKANSQKMSEAKTDRPYAKHYPSEHRYYKAIGTHKAEQIVRKGGVNE